MNVDEICSQGSKQESEVPSEQQNVQFATLYMIRFADNNIDSPPESRRLCLFYREHDDYGLDVKDTRPIIENTIQGRYFETEGGKRYVLGKQEPLYRDWLLLDNGVTPDEDNPFGFDRRDGEKWAFGPIRKRSQRTGPDSKATLD